MDSVETKSVKLPTFDGTKNKFQMWWVRFMAYATVCKFNAALQVNGEHDLPESEATVVVDTATDQNASARAGAARKRNAVAMANLSMAFTTESLMGLIYKSMTMEYPGGLAHLVVKALFAKYQPQDIVTCVELRQMLNKVSMKKSDDPAKLFEQISGIKNKYNTAMKRIDEGDLIAMVLDAAPAEYQAILTAEQRVKGDAVTLQDLENAMTQHWRQISGGTNRNKDNDNEITLAAFNGFCYNCKKHGHCASECKEHGRGNNRKGKFSGKCNSCGKVGHRASDCWDNENNKDKRPAWYKPNRETTAASLDVKTLLSSMSFPNDAKILEDPNIWIADSAATIHATPHAIGFVNKRIANGGDAITVGNGALESADWVGDIVREMTDKSGNSCSPAKLKGVAHIPTSKFNLFSLTKCMKEKWTLGGDTSGIWLSKPGFPKIVFDIVVTTSKGLIFAMHLKCNTKIAGAIKDGKNRMSVAQAHECLGHCNEDAVHKTAKHLGWELKPGAMPVCVACAEAKAKQKNVPKSSEHKPATEVNERIFLDISTVKAPDGETLTKKNWRIMVDKRTNLKFLDFFDTKNGMVEPTCAQLNKWKLAGKPIKYIRCDNAGENKTLQKRCDSSDWKLGIDFEYMARDTPQQNHLAELGFTVIANRGHAMMNQANVLKETRYKVWREAYKTATQLDGLVVTEIDGKLATRYEHWAGKNPKFAKHLRVWGEAGTVKTKTRTTPKLEDHGVQCMFVGYATDHDGDCYHMWDPKTN